MNNRTNTGNVPLAEHHPYHRAYRVWATFDGREYLPVSELFDTRREAAEWLEHLNALSGHVTSEER